VPDGSNTGNNSVALFVNNITWQQISKVFSKDAEEESITQVHLFV